VILYETKIIFSEVKNLSYFDHFFGISYVLESVWAHVYPLGAIYVPL